MLGQRFNWAVGTFVLNSNNTVQKAWRAAAWTKQHKEALLTDLLVGLIPLPPPPPKAEEGHNQQTFKSSESISNSVTVSVWIIITCLGKDGKLLVFLTNTEQKKGSVLLFSAGSLRESLIDCARGVCPFLLVTVILGLAVPVTQPEVLSTASSSNGGATAPL